MNLKKSISTSHFTGALPGKIRRMDGKLESVTDKQNTFVAVIPNVIKNAMKNKYPLAQHKGYRSLCVRLYL